jgi:hypothetical protein
MIRRSSLRPLTSARILAALILLTHMSFAPPSSAQHAPEPDVDASLASPRTLTADQWQSDVRFLAGAIRERHPRPFHSVSEEAFAAATDRLVSSLPGLDYPQILTEISRLVTLLGEGDGHSRARFTPRFIGGQYPVRFWLFADGLFIRSAAPGTAGLAGRRVVGLGGVVTEEALARLSEVVPGDNDFNRRLRMAGYLLMPEILQGLGLADESGLELELETAGGGRESVRLAPIPWPQDFHHTIGQGIGAKRTLSRRSADSTSGTGWSRSKKDGRSSCSSTPSAIRTGGRRWPSSSSRSSHAARTSRWSAWCSTCATTAEATTSSIAPSFTD